MQMDDDETAEVLIGTDDDGPGVYIEVMESGRLAALTKVADALGVIAQAAAEVAQALSRPVQINLDRCRIHKIGEGPAILVETTSTVASAGSFITQEPMPPSDEAPPATPSA